MRETQPADGDVLIYAKVRDPDARGRLWHLLENLPGVRVATDIYEVFTEDWDEGAWEEELVKMQDLIDVANDTLIFWRALDGKMMRTCIAGRFA